MSFVDLSYTSLTSPQKLIHQTWSYCTIPLVSTRYMTEKPEERASQNYLSGLFDCVSLIS